MKPDEKITKGLARTADVMNSINGGTIFPAFETTKENDHYRLEVSTPTIDPEAIKVEVNGGHLIVYQKMEHGDTTIPNVLGVHKISAEVELSNITAGYEDDLLVVLMPFNELTGGFRREIDILRY